MSAKADLEKRNAAWLYFVEKKKYNEIAAVLNITPDQASRRVHQAQAEGWVNVSFSYPSVDRLATTVKNAFGLKSVRVIDSLDAADAHPWVYYDVLGREVGTALAGRLPKNGALGLGGGRGVAVAAAAFGQQRSQPVEVYALGVAEQELFAESATANTAVAVNLAKARLRNISAKDADRVHGHSLYLAGLKEREIAAAAKSLFDQAQADLHEVVLGIGEMASCWVVPDADDRAAFAAAGVYGDVLYDLFGAGGDSVDRTPTVPVCSFSRERLRRIVARGGRVHAISIGKVDATFQLLAGARPIITDLYTDSRTAIALHAQYGARLSGRG